MTKLTITSRGDVAGKLTWTAAACALLLVLLPARATGQLIDRRAADSLSVQQLLEIAARDTVLQRRSDAIVLTAEIIRSDTVGGPRTDSLVRALRDLTFLGIDASMHVTALNALLGSGSAHGQQGMLVEVFDSARNANTRITLLRAAHTLPDSLRRDLLLRGVQRNNSASASYVANVAAMMALQWGPQGEALLWDARMKGLIRDERTLRIIEAALAPPERPPQP